MSGASTSDIPGGVSSEFTTQWTQPSEIFSVLLIVGGDVIQLALAALAGGALHITPVAFSFGWVAYAISSSVSIMSEHRLIRCAPEVPLSVYNLKSGYCRANKSWLLARVVKTYEQWMPSEVRKTMMNPAYSRQHGSESKLNVVPDAEIAPPARIGLCVSVYRWAASQSSKRSKAGIPTRDWAWWSGLVTIAIQLTIAAIPYQLYGDWSILLVVVGGTVLALATGALPQWRDEKWHARRRPKDVALTPGNGTKHVIIVLGSERDPGQNDPHDLPDLDLEDLAAGTADKTFRSILLLQAASMILALLWTTLLISSAGMKTRPWYLLGVGALGTVQNLMAAVVPRKPDALGLPLELVQSVSPPCTGAGSGTRVPEIYGEEKAMWTLMKLEMARKGFGKALVKEFFPGEWMDWEEKWWRLDNEQERGLLLYKQQQEYYSKRCMKK